METDAGGTPSGARRGRSFWARLWKKGLGRKPRPPGTDWTTGGMTDPPLSEAELKKDAVLLDHGFLDRTFKEVHFPAPKEVVLRWVDMEQDFAFGQDRTVNLHNLIAHLKQDTFRSRKDLIRAIRRAMEGIHGRHGA